MLPKIQKKSFLRLLKQNIACQHFLQNSKQGLNLIHIGSLALRVLSKAKVKLGRIKPIPSRVLWYACQK